MTAVQGDRLPDIHFTVASALLKELGERLVGRPAIALAELIKNSYDADATVVGVYLRDDSLIVSDNGHGMTLKEFEDYWMRIGSPHKRKQEFSRSLRRPLTGSKGVGRLAVQFLGHRVNVITKSSGSPSLFATVNWDEAARKTELTNAVAHVRWAREDERSFPENSGCGTQIEITGLNQQWDEEEVTSVARQIWMLQPPSEADRKKMQFEVTFRSDKPGLEKDFGKQMSAIFDIWHARITGKLMRRHGESGRRKIVNQIVVTFKDGETYLESFVIDKPLIETLEYEIRIYDLVGKQRFGLPVKVAREYLESFGNVSVYDGSFRLPFYGRQTDWLDIEIDHAHRLSRSKLLPERLQEQEALNNLPTMTRIFGSVKVDTSAEERLARVDMTDNSQYKRDYLQISVTRDRLLDNKAHVQMKDIVRTAIDLYAVLQTRRMVQKKIAARPSQPLTERIETVEEILEQHRNSLPGPVYKRLHAQITESVKSAEVEHRQTEGYIGLLGALATAGMTMAAYQHEVGRRLTTIEEALSRLESTRGSSGTDYWDAVVTIRNAVSEIRDNREMFSLFVEKESRESVERYRIRPVIKDTFSRIRRLLRGVSLDIESVSDDVRLPGARYMEWGAIFQNVITNASNAMLDADTKVIRASVEIDEKEMTLRLEDTGSGVDLQNAEKLFDPFERRLSISPERRALGLGGSGLGLTVVRMIADQIGCRVRFTAPSEGFNTCFAITWREE